MNDISYKVKLLGDTSALNKTIKDVEGTLENLTNGEFLITLKYDGNIKGFNAQIDKLIALAPELPIDFKYNLNKKALEVEQKKLESILDKEKVNILSVTSDDAIKKQVSDIVAFIKKNTEELEDGTLFFEDEKKIDSISKKIRDLYSNIATGMEYFGKEWKPPKEFAEFISLVASKAYQLDKIGTASGAKVKTELFNTKEIENQKNKIQAVESIIQSIEKDMSGNNAIENSMAASTQQIAELLSKLKEIKDVLEAIGKKIPDTLEKPLDGLLDESDINSWKSSFIAALTDIKTEFDGLLGKNNKLAEVLQGYSTGDRLHQQRYGQDGHPERSLGLSTKTGKTYGEYSIGQKGVNNLSTVIVKDAFEKAKDQVDVFLHTHDTNIAAFSLAKTDSEGRIGGDLITALTTDLKNGINHQIVKAGEEVQLLNAKLLHDDYADAFNDQNITETKKRIAEAVDEFLADFRAETDKYVLSIIEEYGDLSNVDFLSNIFKQYGFDISRYEKNISEGNVNQAFIEKFIENAKEFSEESLDAVLMKTLKEFRGQLSGDKFIDTSLINNLKKEVESDFDALNSILRAFDMNIDADGEDLHQYALRKNTGNILGSVLAPNGGFDSEKYIQTWKNVSDFIKDNPLGLPSGKTDIFGIDNAQEYLEIIKAIESCLDEISKKEVDNTFITKGILNSIDDTINQLKDKLESQDPVKIPIVFTMERENGNVKDDLLKSFKLKGYDYVDSENGDVINPITGEVRIGQHWSEIREGLHNLARLTKEEFYDALKNGKEIGWEEVFFPGFTKEDVHDVLKNVFNDEDDLFDKEWLYEQVYKPLKGAQRQFQILEPIPAVGLQDIIDEVNEVFSEGQKKLTIIIDVDDTDFNKKINNIKELISNLENTPIDLRINGLIDGAQIKFDTNSNKINNDEDRILDDLRIISQVSKETEFDLFDVLRKADGDLDYLGDWFNKNVHEFTGIFEDLLAALKNTGFVDENYRPTYKDTFEGMMHSGLAVGQKYVVIGRYDNEYMDTDIDLAYEKQRKQNAAKEAGADVPKIMLIDPDEYGYVEIQEVFKGENLRQALDAGDALNVSVDAIKEWFKTVQLLFEQGLALEIGGDNQLYTESGHIVPIDLADESEHYNWMAKDIDDAFAFLRQQFEDYADGWAEDASVKLGNALDRINQAFDEFYNERWGSHPINDSTFQNTSPKSGASSLTDFGTVDMRDVLGASKAEESLVDIASINAEKDSLIELQSRIEEIIDAIDRKNKAFQEEESIVLGTSQNEVTQLNTITHSLIEIYLEIKHIIEIINESGNNGISNLFDIDHITNFHNIAKEVEGTLNNISELTKNDSRITDSVDSANNNANNVSAENTSLLSLQTTLKEVIALIELKTQTFELERQVVEQTVNAEKSQLSLLIDTLSEVKTTVEDLSKYINSIKDINFTGKIKIDGLQNLVDSLKDDQLNTKLTAMYSYLDDFAKAVSQIEFKSDLTNQLNNILTKGKELRTLANILQKVNKEKIKDVNKAVNTEDSKALKEYNAAYQTLINTEEKYQTISEKKKSSLLTEEEAKSFSKINSDRTQAEKKIQEIVKATKGKIKEQSDAEEQYTAQVEKTTAALKAAAEARKQLDAANRSESLKNDLQKQIESLNKIQIAPRFTDEFSDKIKDKVQELEKALEGTDEQIEKAIKDAKHFKDTIPKNALNSSYTALDKDALDISQILERNTKMSTNLKEELIELYKTVIRYRDTGLFEDSDLVKVKQRIIEIKDEISRTGQSGKSMTDKLKQQLSHVWRQDIARYFGLNDIVRYARTAFNSIRELDTALVDLRKTTTMSTDELNKFYYQSSDVAKEVGVTTKEIIQQAANWSRLGYSSREAATQMAELSAQFAQISPGMSTETATDGLVSSMKAFEFEVEDVERNIMDNINRIGNTMATNNEEIVKMLERSSAAMAVANNTIEQTIALESAAVQVTRNAETTGTALRTISMRIRGYDEETEELSEDLETISGDIADLTKTASSPGGISLFTDQSKETYKSTYEILKDISAIWDELTDKQQAQLLEKLGGKRGGQVLAAILNDFSEVERAMDEMSQAAGSSDAEMDIVKQSIDYKLNAIRESWVGFIKDAMSREDLGKLFDSLIKGSESLQKTLTALTPIVTAFLTVISELVNALASLNDVTHGAAGVFALIFGGAKALKKAKSGIDDLKNIKDNLTGKNDQNTNEPDDLGFDNVKNSAEDLSEAFNELSESVRESGETEEEKTEELVDSINENIESESAEEKVNEEAVVSEEAENKVNEEAVVAEQGEILAEQEETAAKMASTEANIAETESEIANADANIADAESEIVDSGANITDAETEIIDADANITDAETEIIDAEANMADAASEGADAASNAAGALSGIGKAIGGTAIAKGVTSLAGTLGVSVPVLGAILVAITAVIAATYRLAIAQDEVNEHVKETYDNYAQTTSSLSDYESRIKELRAITDDSTKSIEEQQAAREELLGIQSEMVDQFGVEAGKIDVLRDSVDGLASSFQHLNEEAYQEFINTVNDSGWWNDVGLWFRGYSDEMDSVKGQMEQTTFTLFDKTTNLQQLLEIEKAAEKLGYNVKRTDTTFGKDDATRYTEVIDEGSLRANYDAILKIQKEVSKETSDQLGELANDIKETLDEIEGTYNTYLEHDVIFPNYGEQVGKLTNLMSKLHSAQLENNEEEIERLSKELTQVYESVYTDDNLSNTARDWFENLIKDYQGIIDRQEFVVKMKPEVETQESKNYKTNIEKLKQSGMSRDEIRQKLDIAQKYNEGNGRDQILKNMGWDEDTIQMIRYLQHLVEENPISLDFIFEEEDITNLTQEVLDLIGDSYNKLSEEDQKIISGFSAKEIKDEISVAQSEYRKMLEEFSKEGNVDLTIRPKIDSSAMQAAGWDVKDGSVSTTYTGGEFIWQGDEETGQYVYVHYTPILPDGTVLTTNENGTGTLDEYLNKTLTGAQNVLDADNKGIILKVDTDLGFSEQDIDNLKNGGPISKGLDAFIKKSNNWDNEVHKVQATYYGVDDSINPIDNALDSLLVKAKKANEEIKELSFADAVDSLSELEKQFDTVDKAFAELFDKDDGKVDLSSIKAIKDAFKEIDKDFDFSTIEDELNDLLNATNVEEAQNSVDGLISKFIEESKILESVDESNKDLIASQLELMGVENAEEIVLAALEGRKDAIAAENQFLEATGKSVVNATYAEISAFLQENEVADSTAQHLAQLALEKIHVNGITITCDADCQNLINLANTAMASASALAKLQELKAIINDEHAGYTRQEWAQQQINAINNGTFDWGFEKNKIKLDNFQVPKAHYTGGGATQSAKKGKGGGGGGDKDSAETFDWLETKIKRCEEEIQRLNKTVSATYKSWSKRNEALGAEIGKIREKIALETTAYEVYMQKANAVGLSEHYKQLVINGGLLIEEIKDETIKKQIQEFQTFYEKAIACRDAIEDLNAQIAQLARQKFDNVKAEFEGFTSEIEHFTNMIDKELSHVEAMGKIAGKTFYQAKIDQNTKKLEELNKERGALLDALHEAEANGVEAGSEDWVSMRNEIYAVDESIADLTYELEELKKKMKEVAKLNFDDLKSQFENALSILSGQMDLTDTVISMTQNAGYIASREYYESLIEGSKANVTGLRKEYETLSKTLADAMSAGDIEKYDEQWYAMQGDINNVKKELVDAANATIEYANALRQINWDVFDRGVDRISKLVDEAEFFIELFSYSDLFDKDTAEWTTEGIATRGLMVQEYQTYVDQAKAYGDEAEEIRKLLETDPKNTILIDRYYELIEAQREAILNSKKEKKAIEDLYKDAYDNLLDRIKKLIDAYKNALNAAKDLYDYENTIQDKTKAVTDIQKQLMAYQGDDSEETRATLQKLNTDLLAAQKDLEQTEYERYIQDQQNLLDEFYNQLEEWLNGRIDEIEGLFEAAIEATNLNGALIDETLHEMSDTVDYRMTEEFANIWDAYAAEDGIAASSLNILTLVNDMSNSIRVKMDELPTEARLEEFFNGDDLRLLQQLTSVNDNTKNMINAIHSTNEGIDRVSSNIVEWSGRLGEKIDSAGSQIASAIGSLNLGASGSYDTSAGSGGSSGGGGGGGGTPSSSEPSGKKTNYYITGYSPYGGVPIRQDDLTLSEAQKLEKDWEKIGGSITVKHYTKGGIVGKDDNFLDSIAQLLGEDHMIAAKEGERILTEEQNKNFEKMVNANFTPLDENLKEKFDALTENMDLSKMVDSMSHIQTPNVGNVSNVGNTTTVGDVNISLPNVTNKEEFVQWLKSDGQIERIIQAMTVGRMTGGNSYAKLKY